jgi:hypothetical protein
VVKGTVPTSAEVDAWFEALDHPLKEAMMRVRRIILGADRRITETIKWKSPHVRVPGQHRQHRPSDEEAREPAVPSGASLPGKHPHLEGGGATVRYMRFADLEDLKAKRRDLEAAVRAWCELKTKGR